MSPKTDAIKGINAFQKVTEMKSFLVSFNVFRHFLFSFARIACPSSHKLQNYQLTNFILNENELGAIKRPQQKLMSSLVLMISYRTPRAE